MSRKPKILVIEDNPVNFRLLSVFLEEAGFDIIHAEEGYKGLEIVTAQPDINAILLDRILPDLDGLEVLKSLKKGKSARIPVIMLTAALSTAQIADVMLYGTYACLPKPYDKEKIIGTLRKAVEEYAGGRRNS